VLDAIDEQPGRSGLYVPEDVIRRSVLSLHRAAAPARREAPRSSLEPPELR
jgi:hypothetical protein